MPFQNPSSTMTVEAAERADKFTACMGESLVNRWQPFPAGTFWFYVLNRINRELKLRCNAYIPPAAGALQNTDCTLGYIVSLTKHIRKKMAGGQMHACTWMFGRYKNTKINYILQLTRENCWYWFDALKSITAWHTLMSFMLNPSIHLKFLSAAERPGYTK